MGIGTKRLNQRRSACSCPLDSLLFNDMHIYNSNIWPGEVSDNLLESTTLRQSNRGAYTELNNWQLNYEKIKTMCKYSVIYILQLVACLNITPDALVHTITIATSTIANVFPCIKPIRASLEINFSSSEILSRMPFILLRARWSSITCWCAYDDTVCGLVSSSRLLSYAWSWKQHMTWQTGFCCTSLLSSILISKLRRTAGVRRVFAHV